MYLVNGDSYKPVAGGSFSERIPAGVYVIQETMSGFVLERTADFVVPDKIYGNMDKFADRIVQTFIERPGSTGVLLEGEAGSGKSMLGKVAAIKAMQMYGAIVIIINEAHYGDTFNSFITSINQPAIVFFDEFEKTYDKYDQQSVLTLFDGVCTSKKLYIVTCNDVNAIDKHMLNRPGRLYYSIKFGALNQSFINEYCLENLNNKSMIPSVTAYIESLTEFSFDMLKALIEEMNRYGESAGDAAMMLNIGYTRK